MTGFFGGLEERVREINSLICVGLDPHSSDVASYREKTQSQLSDAKLALELCLNLVNATKHVACAFKPNAAFFEAFGAEGVEALKDLIGMIPDEIPVVLDVKRGDISTTADAYATACFDYYKAQCVTLHPYMGSDSILPFIEKGGAFILCKTSNPSSNELETLRLADGSLLYEKVATLSSEWNKQGNNVGLVVGATDAHALKVARKAAPNLWILAPGVGFQGGNLEESAAAGLREDGMGLLIPISRGISRASDPKAAAEEFRDKVNAVRGMKTDTGPSLPEHQKGFFELALGCGVLKFGSFTLKSGRCSPYFFNAGLFNSGSAIARLGEYYADTIMESGLKFDVLFGPAYKGIPLATAIAVALFTKYGKDVPVAYNRKEAKDHGEGGLLVGAPVKGTRVLIVDDVITAGTAIRESLDILSEEGASVAGVVIALDRQERASDTTDLSAIQGVKKEFDVDVISIVGLAELLKFLQTYSIDENAAASVQAYRDRYGVNTESS